MIWSLQTGRQAQAGFTLGGPGSTTGTVAELERCIRTTSHHMQRTINSWLEAVSLQLRVMKCIYKKNREEDMTVCSNVSWNRAEVCVLSSIIYDVIVC